GFVQSRCHYCECAARTIARVLSGLARQGHQAHHGTPHTGTQNRSHYADTLEKRRRLRCRKTEITSRLSVSVNSSVHLRRSRSGGGQSVLETLGFEGEHPNRLEGSGCGTQARC